MNIIFLGTSNFAVPSLVAIEKKYDIKAVITRKDKPSNRGKIIFSPIKQCALNLKLNLIQYEDKINNHVEEIKKFHPNVIITASFGEILSQEFLNICPVINIHASLLPKYRGSSPIQHAIINGEEYSGVTTMFTELQMDSGDILEQKKIKINIEDNVEILTNKLSIIGAELILITLDKFQNGTLKPKKQDNNKMTKCKMLKKEDGKINWEKSALEIFNFIRGMYSWPTAFTYLNGMYLKLYKSHVVKNVNTDIKDYGTVVECQRELIIKCGQDFLGIDEIQREGKKRMNISTFLLGNFIKIGDKFDK